MTLDVLPCDDAHLGEVFLTYDFPRHSICVLDHPAHAMLLDSAKGQGRLPGG